MTPHIQLPTTPAPLLAALEAQQATFASLRQTIHAYPETAYEEQRTAALVARELASYGVEVYSGIGRTGVVGVLRNGTSPRAIGLRADIDALNMTEHSDLPYRSTLPGKMHGCGHDGHTAMLLMAASHLSATRAFDGTVVLIFQPAEEGGGGARAMINDGLFERFPVDTVYGIHNIPGLPAGQFAVMPGPMMAAGNGFTIVLTAAGGHAALPHTTADPILAGSALVQALQSLVSRSLDPLEPAVLSVTQFHGGEVINVIPATVTLQGTARFYSAAAQAVIETGIERLAAGTAASYGLEATVSFRRGGLPTINSPREAAFAQAALAGRLGPDQVRTDLKPLMTGDDFSALLQARPGAYLWIGNGDSASLHTPSYDFNDAILTTGAAGWVSLVEAALAAG
ncbi:MAG: M20 aminoacylase family protein [Chloroflexales bacterium]